jgi:hypothetical protein
MRTTLSLDDDLYQAAVTLARASGEPLSKVVSRLLRRGLAGPTLGGTDQFPVFSVPPGAPIIPGNRAAELLDEEA